MQLNELGDEHEEARWVAGGDRAAGEEEGVKRADVAVFYRTNAMSRVLEDTLVRYDVPYQVIGGTKFYERAEIKDAVAYLSLLVNPADQVSFSRIVNSPRRGIGNTTQGRLASYANTTGLTIWEVVERVEEVPGLSAAAIKAVGRFHETMEALRDRVEGAAVAEILERVLNETGYLEALAAERTVEAEGRAENLEALVAGRRRVRPRARARGRERGAAAGGVPAADLALHRPGRARGRSEELVTLMTLHNAKGLEYDTVFVVGCEDGAFPHMRALEEGGEEEERRLCYVAITRAAAPPLHDLGARAAAVRPLRAQPALALHRRAAGGADRAPRDRPAGRRADQLGARASPAPSPAEPVDPGPALELQTGDDVVHASFGDGVVTGVEPGGVVIVRFSDDGTERKLMADYAPIRKR